ncbi:MAG: D-alanyl-D-alanine carboxypeptidase/D-alanyl-D-alanine-endopeptidase [Bacteroidales bacterium]
MKSMLYCATILFVFFVSNVIAQENNAQKFIDTQLKTDSLFTNAIVGICAIDKGGEIIAQWNPNFPMLTASTLKTVTTGLGLAYLGEDFRYTTSIAYTGEIKDSILFGNIHIVGGGDPTLGSRDTVAFKIDSIFGIWTNAIKKCGIKKIDGNIIVDDSYFTREQMPDSWAWSNLGPYFGSAPCGLSFCENTQFFTLKPGRYVGSQAKIMATYPHVPGLEIINEVTTAKPKTGDRSAYYVQDMSRISRYLGTIPIDKDSVTSTNSNRFPHISCGNCFREYLLANGIESRSEILDIKFISAKLTSAPVFIAQTYSPQLWKIVNVTNRISNNFYAETILKTIGKKMTGVGSYDSSIVAVNRLLKEFGVNTTGFTMADGSGLSRQNYVSPKFLCNYYTMMLENNIFVKFFESLPYPGGAGTLKNVLKKEKQEIKGKIHAKSGSLSNVRCYAGYVTEGDKGGFIKFAILVNNYSASTSKLQPKIEKFMLELARIQ